jgi:hypothetical protein
MTRASGHVGSCAEPSGDPDDGVHVMDVVNRLEDRGRRLSESIVAEPLDVADPHDHLGQLVSKRVDLDPVELLWADAWERHRHAVHVREGENLFLKIHQPLQGDVQEIPAPARRIEHPDPHKLTLKVCHDLDEGGLPPVTSVRRDFRVALRDDLQGPLPHAGPPMPQGLHEHRLDDQHDVIETRVEGTDLGSLRWVDAPLKQRPEDRRLDARPVNLTS